MTTKLDCYGMTPEERAEFEKEFKGIGAGFDVLPNGDYSLERTRNDAHVWAACAKLNRESLEELEAHEVAATSAANFQ